jgi:BioD-like phosphotransacetylase family protein
MTVLQIISFDSCCKTTLAAGFGKKLLNSGRKVGYIKPVHARDKGDAADCVDAEFMKGVLEIPDGVEVLCPLHVSQEDLWKSLSEDIENFTAKIKADCDKAASGKDVLIMESPAGLKGNKVAELAATTMLEKLGGKAVLMVCYDTGYKNQELVQFAKKLGDKLVGLVINRVPEAKASAVQKEAGDYLKAENIVLLGVIPESRALMGASIAEITSAIGGELLTFKEKAGDLVENVMLGAMTPDSGKDYFSRLKNKAVVTRSERADMQLAALDTQVKCLIISGGKPTTSVMVKADDKKVPLIVVDKDIQDIVGGIEQALAAARFNNRGKLQVISNLMENRIDFKALNTALGY